MSPIDKPQAQTSGSPEPLKDWQLRFLARNQLPATYWAKAVVDYAPLVTSLARRLVKEDIALVPRYQRLPRLRQINPRRLCALDYGARAPIKHSRPIA